jgi:hypothetical protein
MDIPLLIEVCQWSGAIVAVAGAYAVGCQTPRLRLFGFTGFTLSNLMLIIAFTLMKAWPLLGMQLLFLLTSLRGIYSNYHANKGTHD